MLKIYKKDLFKLFKAVNQKSEKVDYETAAQEVLKKAGIDSTISPEFAPDSGAQRSFGSANGGGAGAVTPNVRTPR